MIYILYVFYQNKAKVPDEFLSLDTNQFKIIIFDNSTDDQYLKYNESYCKLHHFYYLTERKNIGLSRAYNLAIKTFITEDDYLLILDADTRIRKEYLDLLLEKIKENKYEVFSPININSKTKEIDSPLKIIWNPLFVSEKVNLKSQNYDYFKVINNGVTIKGSALKKIGYFDERIFLYFSDSYLSYQLYSHHIKTLVINYENECNFSFDTLDHSLLKKRLRIMKRDGYTFYKIIYKKEKKSRFLAMINYHMFCFKKAKECCLATNKKYFLSYLLSGKEKKIT